MQRNLTHFARKGRQFKRLSKEINRLLDSGRFYQLAEEKQRSLASRLRTLYRRLARIIPARRLRLGLGAAAMLLGLGLGLGLTQPLQAQTFGAPVESPFNFTNITYFTLPSFADIDDDGDLDLFTTGYVDGESYYLTLRYYQNVGDAENPDFSAPVDAPFGIAEQNILNVSFVDIDDDGDLDAFMPQAYGNFLFRENTGTAQSPVFDAAQTNPFGLTPLSYFPFASFVDIDGDGDLDVISTEFYGVTYFFENTGTAAAPSFAAPVSDPFGILPPPASILRTIAFSDVDLDGDKDLMYFDFNGDYENSAIFYSENTGTPTAPAFAAGIQGPSGIFFSGYYISSPSFADTDADGDEDLFMGTYQAYGGLVYFENLAIVNALPTTADAEVTTMENIPYAFSANDFPFNDPDAGDVLESIRITGLTSVGSLTWDTPLSLTRRSRLRTSGCWSSPPMQASSATITTVSPSRYPMGPAMARTPGS